MKAFPETAYPGRSSKTKRSRPATWNCWQRSLRQAQSCRDGEPAGLDVEQHERAVVTPAGEIEAGNQLQMRQAHKTSTAPRSDRRWLTQATYA